MTQRLLKYMESQENTSTQSETTKDGTTTGCEKCKKPKEVEINTQNFTEQELEQFMTIADNYKFTPEEINWIYNLYNRVYKQSAVPGCGKCQKNVIRALKNKYNELHSK